MQECRVDANKGLRTVQWIFLGFMYAFSKIGVLSQKWKICAEFDLSQDCEKTNA